MAGGVLKGFGGTFLALGILLLLAGAGAAGFSAYDESEHEEDAGPLGVAQDRDRSDRNEALLIGGGAAAAIGLVLLVLGIVLLASGGSRARRAELHALAGATRAAPDPAGPAASGKAPAPAAGPEGGLRGRKGAIAVVILLGLLVATLAVGLVGRGGEGSLLGLGGPGGDGDEDDKGLITQESASGRMAETVTVLGNSQSAESSAVGLTVPKEATRVQVQVNWTAGLGGVQRLEVQLEAQENGTWTIVAQEAGPSGVLVESDDARLTKWPVRVRVFPAEDGASAGQDFHVVAKYYA